MNRTKVIGLGNPIMGDDGFGLRVLERLQEGWELPADVDLIDGGTWGMNLLGDIEDGTHVLFLDAIHTAQPPGTVAVIEREDLPRFFALKLSPHQVDLREVLALCELRETLPPNLVAMGAQPGVIDMVVGLSPALEPRVDEVAELAAERLQAWGHHCPRRERERVA